ncbi:MAG: PilZ domain-containing protein [Isosphaeraceae bacterium]
MVRSRKSRATAAHAGADRRTTCRYEPRAKSAVLTLGWDNSEGELTVDLKCISLQGCMVRSRAGLPLNRGDPIWLRASDMTDSDWIEGKVVAVHKPFLRGQQIRIHFASSLSFEVFKTLVYGADEVVPVEIIRPEHETDQFWR